MKKLNDIVKANLCIGCGLCSINIHQNETHVKLHFSRRKGHLVPKRVKYASANFQDAFNLCLGNGYQIKTLAEKYSLGPVYHEDIGYYDSLSAVTSNDEEISKKASSSGIMTLIASYLIDEKIVDGAIVTKFEYTRNGPIAKGFIAKNKENLLDAQGSKYCPVNFSSVINELKLQNSQFSYVFIGTPCQIASLKYIQNNIKDLGIKYFIGNFCGGFKSYNNMKRLIKLNNINPSNVQYFRFRGGGQPGSMKIMSDSSIQEIPYPEYVKMTGYSKLKRCHLCVDATAELADFSCGDAWLPKYNNTKIPTSIVIARSQNSTNILNKITRKNQINTSSISEDEIIKSQQGNIYTKKYRQLGRTNFYKLLKITCPKITEGFSKTNKISYLLELNVFLSHKIKLIIENLGLFYFLYYKNSFFKKIFFRLFKDNYN